MGAYSLGVSGHMSVCCYQLSHSLPKHHLQRRSRKATAAGSNTSVWDVLEGEGDARQSLGSNRGLIPINTASCPHRRQMLLLLLYFGSSFEIAT